MMKNYKVQFQVKTGGTVKTIFKEMELPIGTEGKNKDSLKSWAELQFPGCEWAKVVTIYQAEAKNTQSINLNPNDSSSPMNDNWEPTLSNPLKGKMSIWWLIKLPFKLAWFAYKLLIKALNIFMPN